MTSVKIAKDTSFKMRTNSVLKTKVQQMAADKGLTLTEYVTQLILADLRKEDISIELTAKLV